MVRRSAVALLVVLSCARASAEDHPSFRVEVSGTGRPMILIPGLASSGGTWTTTVAHYRARFTCHVLTLAGFAGVPRIDGPLLPTVRRELVDYIRAQKLERPIIVGHSLGGTLALSLAIENPDLVGPLVIVDILPFLAGPNMQAKTVSDAAPAIAAMEAYMSSMSQAQWDAYAKSGASARYMVTAPADLDTLIQWGVASDRRTLTGALAEVYRSDVRDELARIASPTLVLGTWRGVHDQLLANKIDVPKADFLNEFAAQYAKLPLLHFALHDSARHFIMWDDPMWFFDELDAFVADPTARVRSRGF